MTELVLGPDLLGLLFLVALGAGCLDTLVGGGGKTYEKDRYPDVRGLGGKDDWRHREGADKHRQLACPVDAPTPFDQG